MAEVIVEGNEASGGFCGTPRQTVGGPAIPLDMENQPLVNVGDPNDNNDADTVGARNAAIAAAGAEAWATIQQLIAAHIAEYHS